LKSKIVERELKGMKSASTEKHLLSSKQKEDFMKVRFLLIETSLGKRRDLRREKREQNRKVV
jgi:hypothetical protein